MGISRGRARSAATRATSVSILTTGVAVVAANTADREVIDELLNQPVGARGGSGLVGESRPKGFEVYGDSAYGSGATLDEQTARGHDMRAKAPAVRNANGYSKD